MFTADLPTFKRYVGTTSDVDDVALGEHLEAATAWVAERVYPACLGDPGDPLADPPVEATPADPAVVEAILLIASKLYKRRQSPEGVAGFSGEGTVVRVLSDDPDARRMLERVFDTSRLGVG